jgi:pilus assembly protein FimV
VTTIYQRYWVGLMLLGTSSCALGLGLGEIQLNSYLNEPLKAEAPILELKDVDLQDIHVQLANVEEFEKAGLDRPFILSQIKFQVVLSSKGKPVVRFTSKDPLKDPFISLMVEAEWHGGRVIREYTILLDPPAIASRSHAVFSQPKQTALVSVKQPIAQVKLINASSSPTSDNEILQPGSTFGPISPTDTLWRIASRLAKGNQVSVHQAMLSILKKNPHAFLKGNTNGLIKGKTLQLPTTAEMGFITDSEAQTLVKEYSKSWRDGESAPQLPDFAVQNSAQNIPKLNKAKLNESPLKLVTTVMTDAPLEPIKTQAQSTESLPAPTEEISSTQKKNLVDDVNVSEAGVVQDAESDKNSAQANADQALTTTAQTGTPVPINAASNDMGIVSNRLNLLEEALDTLNRVNQDLLSKQEILQQQNESLTKLLTLRDEEMSKLLASVQQGSSVSSSQMPVAVPIMPATSVAVDASQRERNSVPVWVWLLLLGLAGGGTGTVIFLKSRRDMNIDAVTDAFDNAKDVALNYIQTVRSKSKSGTQDNKMSLSPRTESPLVTSTVESVSQALDTKFDIDEAIAAFSTEYDTDVEKKMPTQNGDPDENRRSMMGDLDIYITYERFEPAEDLLKVLLKQYPNFWPAKLKALELYIKMERMQAISDWIAALPDDFSSKSHEDWHEVQNLLKPLGLKNIRPGKPLEVQTLSEDLQMLETNETEQVGSADTADFELPEIVAATEGKHAVDMSNVESKILDSNLSKWEVASQFNLEEEGLKEDLHAIPSKFVDKDDESALDDAITKLELAKAYIQMQDLEGARSLLQQVLKIGNAEQITQAEVMLKQFD